MTTKKCLDMVSAWKKTLVLNSSIARLKAKENDPKGSAVAQQNCGNLMDLIRQKKNTNKRLFFYSKR